ncbi:TPA: ATP-binding cassette domain-containing protein [Candidatus Dojkabacteria bacterium]|uniref:ATP-binding cassette domain-containing protein n=1 Tax=Candidatus Dojkabacteria bacterium TaxID=2099670 RepID=A0A832R8L0_9BACT|nr:ATP-binding cassette domain-containing protein [Candidatus Dojkabacteria bacterium]
MVIFDKVTKKYSDKITALEDVSFSLDKGEFSFLVGPSGAGKTTLLRLLIREELPTSGQIIFDKIDVPQLPNKLLPTYRQRLGIVFQDIKLLEGKTLEENINFALEILGKQEKEIKETTDYLLELVKLQDRRNLFPQQLSGGEQQRGAIARALANNPDFLVADEPTGNLDPDSSFQILDILNSINKAGTTVMVITHDREMVNKMKTRVIRMEEGKIVSDSKGNYDTLKKPKEKVEKPEVKKIDPNIKIGDEANEGLEKKANKVKYDKDMDGLDKEVLEKLLNAQITTINLIFNLTEEDLDNLDIKGAQRDKLEDFLTEYLNKKQKK